MAIEQRITLGDGTVLEGSHCGYADRDLWCFVKGKTMMECMQLFSDPAKISVIESFFFVKTYRYTGFTDLLLVQKSRSEDDVVDVRLTWPEGQPHSVEEIVEEEAPTDERNYDQ